jgi:DNA-binding XRE family transcriptional regulator
MKHEDIRKKLLARKGVKDAYEAMSEEFTALDVLLKARKQAKLTQEEVAARMGTTKSAVSRLESSLTSEKHSPSVATLRKYALACGKKLVLSIR